MEKVQDRGPHVQVSVRVGEEREVVNNGKLFSEIYC